MELTPRIIKNIVAALKRTQPNEIDCGDCFDRLERFAEMTLAGKAAWKALPLVQLHLEGCRDCGEEFEALLDVLRGLGVHEQTRSNTAT